MTMGIRYNNRRSQCSIVRRSLVAADLSQRTARGFVCGAPAYSDSISEPNVTSASAAGGSDMRVKDVLGYEGLYVVTDDGRVISIYHEWDDERGFRQKRTSKVLEGSNQGDGYPVVNLTDHRHVARGWLVHRLVAQAFCEPYEGECVNHKDGVRTNNHWSNLEWSSAFADTLHSVFRRKGVKLTATQIMEIQQLDGMALSTIAERYKVDRTTVIRILAGKKTK